MTDLSIVRFACCILQAMLKRLENAKATTTLRKDKLLTDFNNHTMAGVSMGVVHPLQRKKKGFRSPSPYDEYRSKSSMMSDTSESKIIKHMEVVSGWTATAPTKCKDWIKSEAPKWQEDKTAEC